MSGGWGSGPLHDGLQGPEMQSHVPVAMDTLPVCVQGEGVVGCYGGSGDIMTMVCFCLLSAGWPGLSVVPVVSGYVAMLL